MKLEFLTLDKLHRSRSNMRFTRKAPDVADILPSIRARGVLVPIVVRPEPDADGNAAFGVIAGDRRYAAACIVADEVRAAGGEPEPMPCAIVEEGDDAAALEASMIENMARLDPDEVTRWESFTALVKQGRSVEDIATTFGLPDLAVRRTLALGNLLPRVRTLYRAGEIDATTVRHLTMASKSQQKAWLALVDDPDVYVPSGHQLKAWLFGGQSIPTRHALFDIEHSGLAIVSDLFGEQGYFADADAFWAAQNAEITAQRDAYLEAGWADVVIVPTRGHFSAWEMERTPKRKGGRVYIEVRTTGEVCFHEGFVTSKEAKRQERGQASTDGDTPARPEITSAMRTYVDLHRHAAVRVELTGRPEVALRMMVAHAIAGSPLWRVEADPRHAPSDPIAESTESAIAEAAFDGYRRAAQARLGYPADETSLIGRHGHDMGVPDIFARLRALPDTAVMEIVAIVVGETLASGSAAVDAVGAALGTDMARWWEADDAFFDLVRNREVLGAIVGEVAGDLVAKANVKEKAKTLKSIIRAYLTGEGGRAKVEHWVPRWMTFPPSGYTTRGGTEAVVADGKVEAAAIASLRSEPDAASPGNLPDPDFTSDQDPAAMPLAA